MINFSENRINSSQRFINIFFIPLIYDEHQDFIHKRMLSADKKLLLTSCGKLHFSIPPKCKHQSPLKINAKTTSQTHRFTTDNQYKLTFFYILRFKLETNNYFCV